MREVVFEAELENDVVVAAVDDIWWPMPPIQLLAALTASRESLTT